MSCVKFEVYDKRVKAMNILEADDQVFLVTVSTEGYITLWGIEILLERLSNLKNKMMVLGDEFEPIYHFQINSRIICLASKLNFTQVEKTALNQAKQNVLRKSRLKEEKIRLNKKITKRKFLNNKLKKLQHFKRFFN